MDRADAEWDAAELVAADDDDDTAGGAGGTQPGGAIMSIHIVVKSEDAPMRSVLRTDHWSAAGSADSSSADDEAEAADAEEARAADDDDAENGENAWNAGDEADDAATATAASVGGCRRKCSGRIAKYARSRSQCTRRRHRAKSSAIGKCTMHSDK